jgi:hypothetical protein
MTRSREHFRWKKAKCISTAKTRRSRRIQIKKRFLVHFLGFLRVLRAFAVRKHLAFTFEPAKDGNAVAGLRPLIGCRRIGRSSFCFLLVLNSCAQMSDSPTRESINSRAFGGRIVQDEAESAQNAQESPSLIGG